MKPESFKRLRQYFLWHNNIPYFERATSIPIKYFSFPKSFILKELSKVILIDVNSFKPFHAKMASSTYTDKIVIKKEFAFMNKEWLDLACWYLCSRRNTVSLSYQYLLAFLSPYRDLTSLHAWLGLAVDTPSGTIM